MIILRSCNKQVLTSLKFRFEAITFPPTTYVIKIEPLIIDFIHLFIKLLIHLLVAKLLYKH